MSIAAHLEYYPDNRPGIRRERRGRGFSYIAPDGTRIDQKGERARLNALAVPPAWEQVWMSPLKNGHLQATGRDVKTRKQYRYHPEWNAFRSKRKFAHLSAFGKKLPSLRRRILRDLRNAEAGDRTFVIAAVLALIDRASLRVGAPDYTQENQTYGATTLRKRHLSLENQALRLFYTGKGGAKIEKTLSDRTLNRVLSRLDDLPGPELMTWVDEDGAARAVTSGEVNGFLTNYLEDTTLTAKTFRTWNGSVAAMDVAMRAEKPTIKSMTEAAAQRLANTPAICRSSYVHPAVIDLHSVSNATRRALGDTAPEIAGLRRSEAQLLHLLEGNTG
ncbi:DNA topoisomerase IB [Marivita sp. XM-24bin2]|jgi:DNA topoisomerase-1|uniref:DNA topoisomerase IB n=1 Tax=Marivita sp. XM-24bin2 TaxID=2133951 RepID=UPI000D7B485C|nr:DNA topoisomerase IB [Marivita sp. XM-24bin2]MCR9107676.1 DNA topoisomerase IB [Paracoccaceae bacterium]PWL35571.1 MAG: DNA topoisomerase [Marivita sp. XM-24bin2]